jgi:hypothetical protein
MMCMFVNPSCMPMTPHPDSTVSRKSTVTEFAWSALLVGVLLSARILASVVLPMYDDAFITFRYARNLAVGNGFVYQPGEWILGTTAPGYGLLTSCLYLIQLPMPSSAIWLNLGCEVVLLLVLVSMIPNGSRRAGGAMLTACISASPILSRIGVGGMESSVFVLLSVSAIAMYLAAHRRAATVIAALAYLFRPEAVLLLAIMPAAVWIQHSRREAVICGIIALLSLLSIWGCLYAFYGTVIPQSVLAKSSLPKLSAVGTLLALLGRDPVIFAAFPLALIAILTGARKTPLVAIVGGWMLAFIAAYMAARPHVWSWYGAAVDYAILFLAVIAVMEFGVRANWTRRLLKSRLMHVALLLLPVLAWIATLSISGASRVTENVYTPLKRWCAEHNLQGKAILAGDIGVVGYYSGGRIYDLAGLVWPEGLRYAAPDSAVVARAPDYLFLNANKAYLAMMSDPRIASRYVPVARFSRDGRVDNDIRSEDLGEVWVQDYLLYERMRNGLPRVAQR